MCGLLHDDTGARCHKGKEYHTTHVGWSHYPGQIVSWEERTRTDKRGRRIGYNWWREYNCSLLLDATLAWEREREDETSMYQTEVREWQSRYPCPNLKDFLLANAGMNTPS